MPQEKELQKLIGKVDLMIAAAEPGLVMTEEMVEVGVETLARVRQELNNIKPRPPSERVAA